MKKIYKYILDPSKLRLSIPEGAKVLSVGNQYNNICVWVELDPDKPLKTLVFEVYGTGHDIPEGNREFIGTVLLHDGSLVFHVYKRKYHDK